LSIVLRARRPRDAVDCVFCAIARIASSPKGDSSLVVAARQDQCDLAPMKSSSRKRRPGSF